MQTLEKPARLSFGDVLVVTELPPWADPAVPYALGLARSHNAKICIAHAVPANVIDGGILNGLPATGAFRLSWRDELLKAGAQHVLLDAGDVAARLHFMINRRDFDLVIVSARKGGDGDISLGKAARELLRAADCPVLVFGPGLPEGGPARNEPATILHATDFSPHAIAAAQHAFSWALEYGARLSMLHVVESAGATPDRKRVRNEETYLDWLTQLVPDELPVWCELDRRVSFGTAGPAIIESAREQQADLIVLGLSGQEGPSALGPGRTVLRVIREAPCPVLVVREFTPRVAELEATRDRDSSAAVAMAA